MRPARSSTWSPNFDDEIDIVITGHTNWAVNCLIDGKVVTGAAAQGRLVTDIDAQIDRSTGDFVPDSIVANNEIVTQDVPKAKDDHAAHREVQRLRRADRRGHRGQRHGSDGQGRGNAGR